MHAQAFYFSSDFCKHVLRRLLNAFISSATSLPRWDYNGGVGENEVLSSSEQGAVRLAFRALLPAPCVSEHGQTL